MNNRVSSLFAIVWLILGLFWFGKRKVSISWTFFSEFSIYFWLFYLGVFFSFFTAYFFWQQDFVSSFIVNRHLVWLLYIPFLFYIGPNYYDLIRSFHLYTFLYALVWLIQSFSNVPLTVSLLNKLDIGTYNGVLLESEFGYLIPGYQLILISFYYFIFLFIERPKLTYFFINSILILFIFLLQNRGILFVALPVYFYSFIKLKGKLKFLSFVFLICLLFVNSTINIWNGILEETTVQFENKDYNRWKSYYFFVFEYSPSLLCDIFGNGFLSLTGKGGEFIYRQKLLGYYQSDLGIIGLWSIYGLLPIVSIFLIIYKIIFGYYSSFFLKSLAFHILIIPIAWNFSLSEIFIFISMIYFHFYEKKQVSIAFE